MKIYDQNFPVDLEKFQIYKLIGYKPHKGQVKVHKSKARIKIVRAGRRYGKSILAGAGEGIPALMHPGSRIWIVAETYSLGEKEWRYVLDGIFGGPTFPNSLIKELIDETITKRDNVSQGQLQLKIRWKYSPFPSEIVVKSWDNPNSLLGEELDLIIASEGSLLPRRIWERHLRATLISRNGCLIVPSTSADSSELMDELYERGQKKRDKDVDSWEFAAFDNPYWAENIPAEKARLKKELSKEAYEEQVLGKKVHFIGRFYKEFDQDLHVAPLNFDENRVIYRTWDFGFRHPYIGWFQTNKRDQLLWLYSYLGADLDDQDLVEIGQYLSGQRPFWSLSYSVKSTIDKEGLIPFFTVKSRPSYEDYCDAAGTQVKSSSGSSIKILHDHDIHPHYKREIAERDENGRLRFESVKIIRKLLKKRHDGRPSILVDSDNKIGIDMFRMLAFDENQNKRVQDQWKQRQSLLEIHPHDALRYLVMHLFKGYLYENRRNTSGREIAYA